MESVWPTRFCKRDFRLNRSDPGPVLLNLGLEGFGEECSRVRVSNFRCSGLVVWSVAVACDVRVKARLTPFGENHGDVSNRFSSSSTFLSSAADETRSGSAVGFPKTSFLPGTKLFSFPNSRRHAVRRLFTTPSACSFDHIPKRFREENLKDGLMDNYKNAPKYLYGLTPSQMDMFMTEDSPIRRQSEKVTEESISSAKNYLDHGGMWSSSGMKDRGPSRYSMSVSMYRGGARGYGRPRTAPPDLPSLLLDARICYLGMPIVPAVTELLVAQLMWLDYDNSSKPIYLYINSPGTQNEKMETVGSETEAYAIADTMAYCKSKFYTINCGMAYGQAAMLLSLGAKGYRALQPNASTKLYLPKVNKSSGAVIDMWIKAKELDANTDYYIELLAKGTGKPKEEIAEDIQRPKYFQTQEAIAYGIADKIIDSRDVAYEKRNYDEMLAQSKATRRGAGVGPQAAPSGLS